ncbi:SDR family NAD(P)-dependent oxidoreductase [Flammeovirga sp. OC4]|uniref:SDR family NAD(P)-dependent oxidoreductase n=1 Tax=Flammeovirga sp. OC4 TaxID=1382345 RepID=UPI0005C4AC07|nr:SDR family NAD(P)-dependent oxidoreductase [Flammeovirga sp. OC4]
MKKIALVTGANKGLGLETARQLAQANTTVLIASRNKERGLEAVDTLKIEGLDVDLVQLNVTNETEINALVQEIDAKFGQLDILVNNAGIIHSREPKGINSADRVEAEVLRETFDVNFFGLVLLTQKLLPLLKKSKAASIVNVSSILGSNTIQSDESSPWSSIKPFAYNASKTALNSFTVHLAAALKETNITVNSAHPGWVKTELGGENAPLETPEGAKTSVSLTSADFTGKFIHDGEEIAW